MAVLLTVFSMLYSTSSQVVGIYICTVFPEDKLAICVRSFQEVDPSCPDLCGSVGGCCPAKQKVAGWIPGCMHMHMPAHAWVAGPVSGQGTNKRQPIGVSLSHRCFSPSFPLPSLSLKINKILKKSRSSLP